MVLRRLVVGVVVMIGALGVPLTSAMADTPFAISASPSMTPGFAPWITDYAISCVGGTATITVTAGPVLIGGRSIPGAGSVEVPMTAGQQVVVQRPGVATYHLRCVPSDFPSYTSSRTGAVQSEGFLVQPGISFTANISQPYTIAFDADGVPV